MKYQRLGDLLTSVGVISEEQLQTALKLQKGTNERLGTVLVSSGIISEKQLIEALQMQLGVEFVDLTTVKIPAEMAQVLSKNIARKYSVVPIKLVNNELYLAMADPLNFMALEEVKAATKKRVIPVIATASATERAIANLYGNEGAVRAIEELAQETTTGPAALGNLGMTTQLMDEDSNAAPTIRLVNSIIERAATEQASDIHIEPRETEMVVRMRIDGMLRQILTIPKNVQNSVISRLKIMGGMDIAERRVPQDGRTNVRIKQQSIDIRISTLPTIYGEKTVLRLLNKNASMLTMEGIGLSGENLVKFKELIHGNVNGVILIVGPTGSGKSSSMYTMLSDLNSERVNIVSLEDPVEYNMDGINQVQINDKMGLTFASGLRSILRQDPDIISVGEIRDGETADIAMRSAITGHLVLSTVHTNDAVSALDRLADLGVEPYLVASAMKGVISQRLLRRVCPHCRRPHPATAEELEMLGLPTSDAGKYQFYKGEGCPDCFHTGYRGRIAAFEILTITSKIRQAIFAGSPRSELQSAVEESGFSPMIDNCRELVMNGVTTADEVFRVVQSAD